MLCKVLLVLLLCAAVECQLRGLFPAILNLASNANITTNATCGEMGPEMFCKLVEHVPGRPVRNAQCRVCDQKSENPKERHPITNAIDGTNDWWQSPSIQNGRAYHWVTITLDLRQVFQVAYIIIKAANSPRPGNWILERSLDGIEFTPWQYYAISDSECLSRYNVTPRLGTPTYKRDNEVICTSFYSKLVPLEHGEIHASLINGRPSADDPSPTLLEFTSARFIRLRLQRIRTLNADLMTLNHHDLKDVDPIVTRRYYYSIKDVSVGGMCICYGHARSCPFDEVTKKLQCQCERNTCGESCNECCPGYHQNPWRPGTISVGSQCEKCNCHNKAEDCYYDQNVADRKISLNIHDQYIGGGVCIECTQFTAGINCETCIEGYYRSHQVSPYSDGPCHPCECDPFGSISSVCVVDDNRANIIQGVFPGQCHCKEGYTGTKCDQCEFGYKGYPNCVRCNCSLVGSINDDPCADQCICKEHVEGENCDQCKPGFYNLQARNPEGCTECFCFGVSGVCDGLFWHTTQVSDINGWYLTDLQGNHIQPQQDQFDGPHQISINNTMARNSLMSALYWEAPSSYLGNKLTSYGGVLRYTVSYDVPMDSTDTEVFSGVDFILQGSGDTLGLKADGVLLQPYEEHTTEIKLLPEYFIEFYTRRPVDRDRLMAVLANINHLRIRASYNLAKNTVTRLSSVTLDIAKPNVIALLPAVQVENCECPPGYAGTSCESCISGHYRVGGTLFGGICQPCECNGHATECDIHGACYDCQHNTMGHHCDQCLPGFYGNPLQGKPDDCQSCACPLSIPSNNFSPTCHLSIEGEPICDQCAPGYVGARCEKCANGYYGNPSVPGGSCVPCDCNGNIDPFENGHCDTVTGECLKCTDNTSGWNCERCADGHYGDAILAKNCTACQCHPDSSISEICHHETGLCDCKPNVFGTRCDQCSYGFYGLTSGVGCLLCNCSQSGSVSQACSDAGQCHCVPGVAGLKCDICAQGFYAFQDGGCTPCDCAHTHNNCDPLSGQCICPPHTHGAKCEFCDSNYWGHDPELGCLECNCSTAGSKSLQCDITTGLCQCKEEFGGQNCHACLFGHRNYPECIACDCDSAGTQSAWCDDEQKMCSCVEDTGVCACKDNVVGSYCNECKAGSYALDAKNPLGCSPCFCSGVSSLCAELEGYVHIPISLVPDRSLLRVVTVNNLEGTTEGVFSESVDMLLDAGEVRRHLKSETFYWQLATQFLGDKILAYGGKLKYVVTYYALDDSSDFEPQLIMKGGRASKLVITMNIPTPANAVRSEIEASMTETNWKYFNSVSEQSVTRSDFMSVLSNIDYILIKASYGYGLQQSRISNISLDIAVESSDMHSGREVARYVEICVCPVGYRGLSCQECAPGYYRENLLETNILGSQPLNTPCIPCKCSNHSETCDPDTGECMDCKHNTAGHHCHVCAPGYYGKVTGSIADCSLCACPKGNTQSFSPTCVLDGINDFRCDACLPGYEGKHCERCSLGYHGNPNEPGGSCHKCDCNPSGSMNNECDRVTGQCLCKKGVTGRLCDTCELRHILLEEECISCDDDCTGTLLDDLDRLQLAFSSFNISSIGSAPYSVISRLENVTQFMKESVPERASPLISLDETMEQLTSVSKDTNRLEQQMEQIIYNGHTLNNATITTLNKSQELLGFIDKMQSTIKFLVEVAETFNETMSTDTQLSENTILNYQDDVSFMLSSMRSKDFGDQNQNATKNLKASQGLLSRVQKEYEKPHIDLTKLKNGLQDTFILENGKLLAAKDLLHKALTNTNHTNHLLLLMQKYLADLNMKKQNLQENKNRSVMLIEEGIGLVDDAVLLAEDTVNTTSALETHVEELILWNAKLRHHVDDLVMQMSKRNALDLVYKAEDYAAEFQKLSASLNSSLLDVRDVSLNATSAIHVHTDIKTMIEQSQILAEESNHTAAEVLALLSSSKKNSQFSSKNSMKLSTQFLKEVKNLSRNTEGLVSDLNGLKTKVEKIQKRTHAFTHRINEQLLALRSLPNDTSEKLHDAKELAVSANSSAADTLNHIMTFHHKVQNATSTLSKINDTLQKTNELLVDSSKTVGSAKNRIKEVENQANILLDRLKPLKLLEENLSRNLSEIKELISQARKQAASIKVAVSADRDCVRSYQPDLYSTNYNTLTLNVKTAEPDNLLFYLGSNNKADFMAIEMRQGRVSFLWDLGSGSVNLEEPDIEINNNKWHKIHVSRFGKSGSLSVEEVASSQKSVPKNATSPGTSSILHVDNSTLMFVGGIGAKLKKSQAVKITHFKGCMGEAFLNGRSVGLWNYIKREGKCGGCFGSPQDEDTAFNFDGSGYSVVEKTLRSTTTQIVIHFRTFAPNGLLLYLASNGTRDYLSLEIVDGKIRLSVELGSGPFTLMTDGRYNDGLWYKVAFQRNKKQGILAVMDSYNSSQRETKQGEAPGSASDLNRSDKDPIYIGGLPRSRTIRKQLSSRTYVGCIKNLEISRSNFDLLRNAYGVRKGCKLEPTRSITVLNDGYVEMLPVSLSPESELMVSFSTLNDTGIILAGFGKGTEKRSRRQAIMPFFALMLVNGHIELHINPVDGASTRRVTLKSPSGTYSDGQEHSVIIIRNKRLVSVQVDEGKPAEIKMNGPSVDSVTINTSTFYVGGIPGKIGTTTLKTSQSFYGCIRNLILNMEQMDFTTVLKYEHVQMDSCMLSEKPKSFALLEQELPPTATPGRLFTERKMTTPMQKSSVTKPPQCAIEVVPDHVPNAHQFGLTQRSHIVLPFDQSSVRRKLSVQVTMRTFATSGLVYYMAHQNQMDYAALQIHSGKLYFLFDMGKGRTETIHPAFISDGKWHTVTTEYVKRKITITVDGQESSSFSSAADSNTLDVEGKLYLGGLPLDYTAKSIGNITHSVPACIGNVVINNKQLDKENAISIHAVNKCYASAQKGTYFDGSGFAALVKDGYKVRSDLNITLEFRTTNMNGVLIGISSAKVDAIGLEIVNGKVLFHVNNGAGRISAVYKPQYPSSLCDGKWHKLQANKIKHRIVLTVDGNAVNAESPHVQSTSADTNNPVYVGGYPADVKQNCLTSQTSFHGCIRDLKLVKGTQTEADDFSKAFELRGVFPHSCPGTEL
ncbi:laminin subunit alpha-1 isoform X1 [Pelobates fuscus]|uniref:laminin subunit alpha-1 isoform X1 n=1 Tax=Pelobates fuscus TaxID=191477 RepID=UPI002FE4301B